MRTDIQQEVDRQMVLFIVQRNIFCPVSGQVLDIRTCKWFVDKDGDPAYVVAPHVYDAAIASEATVEALSQRGYFPMDYTG